MRGQRGRDLVGRKLALVGQEPGNPLDSVAVRSHHCAGAMPEGLFTPLPGIVANVGSTLR